MWKSKLTIFCVFILLAAYSGVLVAEESFGWRDHLTVFSSQLWRLFELNPPAEKAAKSALENTGPRMNVFDRPDHADAALRAWIASRLEDGATLAQIEAESSDQILWYWISTEELRDVNPLYSYAKTRGEFFDDVKDDPQFCELWVYPAGYGDGKTIYICATLYMIRPNSMGRLVRSIFALLPESLSTPISIILHESEYNNYRFVESDRVRLLDVSHQGCEVPDVLLCRGPLNWDISHEEELELWLFRFAGGGEPWTMLSYVRLPYAEITAYDPATGEIEVAAQIARNPDEEVPTNNVGLQRIVYKVANGSIAELPERREVLIAPSPPPQQ